MRERTTWDRTRIANNLRKLAEDPRSMNQDHLSQQPGADDYDIGGPSEFAEDVSPIDWRAEYSNGTTKRNEIGLPEFAGSTFTASLDREAVKKKAQLCSRIAQAMLPRTASMEAIEDQALALMDLPSETLRATLSRLASEDEDDEGEEQTQDQSKEAAKKSQQQEGKQGQEEEQTQDQSKEAAKKSQQQEGKQGQDEEQGQDEGQAKQGQDEEQGQDEGQAKQARAMIAATANYLLAFPETARAAMLKAASAPIVDLLKSRKAQMSQQSMDQLQAQVQNMVQQACQQMMGQQQQQAQDQMQMAQQDQMQMAQQQAQQQAQQAQQQAQQAQQQAQQQDADILDQMLQDGDDYFQQGTQVFAEGDVQMDVPSMDLSEVAFSPEDAVLSQVFASGSEVRYAMEANNLQGLPNPEGVVTASAHGTRTASRKVGTHPTGGVGQLGGVAPAQESNDVTSLSKMWATSPDLTGVF